MSEIKIILEAGAEFQSIAKANEQLKEMSTILTQMKDTKLALSGAESVANVQKLTAETKKLEQQVEALKTKSAAAAEKEKKALADQNGLLGQLIQKKKALQGSLVGAKTIDDVQRINKEISNTNQEVLRLKTTGISSFNSFEKAITSFQFKFNFLGNLVSSFATYGLGFLQEQLVKAVINLDLLGETAEETATRMEKLEAANRAVSDSAQTLKIATIQSRVDILKAREKLDGETIESAKSISAEEKKIIQSNIEENQKAIDKNTKALSDAIKERSAIIAAAEKITTTVGPGGEIRETKAGESKAQRERRQALEIEQQNIIAKNNILLAEDVKLKAQLEINEIALKDHIQDINNDTNKKNEENSKNRLKLESKEADENFRIWQTTFKKKQDEEERIRKEIAKAQEDQRKLDENQREYEQQQEEEENKINKENIKKAAKEAADQREKDRLARLESEKKITDGILEALQKRQQNEIDATEEKLSQQDAAIARQQELADKGLANTLAFEEKRKAELEQAAREEQKRLERLKKIEAYYNLFASYAKEDPKNAAIKAFKDIAIAEAITAAFAAEGGIVGEISDSTQIGQLGASKTHGMGMDRLVVADKREGILTVQEMNALGGKDGFYNLKQILNNPSDDGEFQRAEQSFANAFVPKRRAEGSGLEAAVNKLAKKIEGIEKIQTAFDGAGNLITRSELNGMVKKIIRPKREI